jgi:hypothetical protein
LSGACEQQSDADQQVIVSAAAVAGGVDCAGCQPSRGDAAECRLPLHLLIPELCATLPQQICVQSHDWQYTGPLAQMSN